VRYTDDDTVIIVLSNLGSAAFNEISDSLAAIVFEAPYQMPSKRTFVKVDPAVLADYLGEYELTYFGRKSILRFTLEGDHMMMHVQGLPTSVTSAFSDTEFYTRSKGEVELKFMRDGAAIKCGHPFQREIDCIDKWRQLLCYCRVPRDDAVTH